MTSKNATKILASTLVELVGEFSSILRISAADDFPSTCVAIMFPIWEHDSLLL